MINSFRKKGTGTTGTLSRETALALLDKYGQGAGWTKHCRAVADGAEAVGRALAAFHRIDIELLWTSALLHDIGRYVTHDPILHGVEGYLLLSGLGYQKHAFVCASHVLFGLHAAEASRFGLPARDFVPQTYGERIVPLVDFLVEGNRAVSLEHRFRSLRQRNRANVQFVERLDDAYTAAADFKVQLETEIGGSLEGLLESATGCP